MKLYKLPLGICLACLCFMQIGCGPKDLETFRDCDECPEMVRIPAGSFLMGASPFTNLGNDSQKPQHQVEIQAFAIGKFEVTQEQWYAVMGTNPSEKKGRTLPVDTISWDDAQLFVEKLSQKTGKKYRLLSESEWEYSARAGTTSDFYWGVNWEDDSNFDDYAWYINNSNHESHPIGLKKPNKFGLHDMAGNSSEWVADRWNHDYTDSPSNGSARSTGPDGSDHIRLTRGGSYLTFPNELSTANRKWTSQTHKDKEAGIRVARDLP